LKAATSRTHPSRRQPLADIRILQDRERLLAIMKDGVFHKPPQRQRPALATAAE
jgi:hypothetical protein